MKNIFKYTIFTLALVSMIGFGSLSQAKAVQAQGSIWEVGKTQVQSGQQASIKDAVKSIASRFSVSIPEWNWNATGKYDAKKLSTSFLKSIATALGIYTTKAQEVPPTNPTFTISTVDKQGTELNGNVHVFYGGDYLFYNQPSPKTFTVADGSSIVPLGASNALNSLWVGLTLQNDHYYQIDAKTGAISDVIPVPTGKANYIDIVFELVEFTIANVDTQGNYLYAGDSHGATYSTVNIFDNAKNDYLFFGAESGVTGKTFTVAEGGSVRATGAYGGLASWWVQQFSTSLQNGHYYRVDAKTGALISDNANPSADKVNHIDVVYDLVNYTIATTDSAGGSIDGTVNIYDNVKNDYLFYAAVSPKTFSLADGGSIRASGQNPQESVPNQGITITNGTTYILDNTTTPIVTEKIGDGNKINVVVAIGTPVPTTFPVNFNNTMNLSGLGGDDIYIYSQPGYTLPGYQLQGIILHNQNNVFNLPVGGYYASVGSAQKTGPRPNDYDYVVKSINFNVTDNNGTAEITINNSTSLPAGWVTTSGNIMNLNGFAFNIINKFTDKTVVLFPLMSNGNYYGADTVNSDSTSGFKVTPYTSYYIAINGDYGSPDKMAYFDLIDSNNDGVLEIANTAGQPVIPSWVTGAGTNTLTIGTPVATTLVNFMSEFPHSMVTNHSVETFGGKIMVTAPGTLASISKIRLTVKGPGPNAIPVIYYINNSEFVPYGGGNNKADFSKDNIPVTVGISTFLFEALDSSNNVITTSSSMQSLRRIVDANLNHIDDGLDAGNGFIYDANGNNIARITNPAGIPFADSPVYVYLDESKTLSFYQPEATSAFTWENVAASEKTVVLNSWFGKRVDFDQRTSAVSMGGLELESGAIVDIGFEPKVIDGITIVEAVIGVKKGEVISDTYFLFTGTISTRVYCTQLHVLYGQTDGFNKCLAFYQSSSSRYAAGDEVTTYTNGNTLDVVVTKSSRLKNRRVQFNLTNVDNNGKAIASRLALGGENTYPKHFVVDFNADGSAAVTSDAKFAQNGVEALTDPSGKYVLIAKPVVDSVLKTIGGSSYVGLIEPTGVVGLDDKVSFSLTPSSGLFVGPLIERHTRSWGEHPVQMWVCPGSYDSFNGDLGPCTLAWDAVHGYYRLMNGDDLWDMNDLVLANTASETLQATVKKEGVGAETKVVWDAQYPSRPANIFESTASFMDTSSFVFGKDGGSMIMDGLTETGTAAGTVHDVSGGGKSSRFSNVTNSISIEADRQNIVATDDGVKTLVRPGDLGILDGLTVRFLGWSNEMYNFEEMATGKIKVLETLIGHTVTSASWWGFKTGAIGVYERVSDVNVSGEVSVLIYLLNASRPIATNMTLLAWNGLASIPASATSVDNLNFALRPDRSYVFSDGSAARYMGDANGSVNFMIRNESGWNLATRPAVEVNWKVEKLAKAENMQAYSAKFLTEANGGLNSDVENNEVLSLMARSSRKGVNPKTSVKIPIIGRTGIIFGTDANGASLTEVTALPNGSGEVKPYTMEAYASWNDTTRDGRVVVNWSTSGVTEARHTPDQMTVTRVSGVDSSMGVVASLSKTTPVGLKVDLANNGDEIVYRRVNDVIGAVNVGVNTNNSSGLLVNTMPIFNKLERLYTNMQNGDSLIFRPIEATPTDSESLIIENNGALKNIAQPSGLQTQLVSGATMRVSENAGSALTKQIVGTENIMKAYSSIGNSNPSFAEEYVGLSYKSAGDNQALYPDIKKSSSALFAKDTFLAGTEFMLSTLSATRRGEINTWLSAGGIGQLGQALSPRGSIKLEATLNGVDQVNSQAIKTSEYLDVAGAKVLHDANLKQESTNNQLVVLQVEKVGGVSTLKGVYAQGSDLKKEAIRRKLNISAVDSLVAYENPSTLDTYLNWEIPAGKGLGEFVLYTLPLINTDGDDLIDALDDCKDVAGPASNFGCPAATIRVSIQEVDNYIKTGSNHRDEALETKIFNLPLTGSCANLATTPSNYAQIWNCAAEVTGVETNALSYANNKPVNKVGELAVFKVTPGSKLILVKAPANLDGAVSGYVGFDSPNMLAGQSRDAGFNIVTGKPTEYVQTAILTRNSKGVWESSRRAQVLTGTELDIFQPDSIDWDATGEQIYPFTFLADGDWDVNVCLAVPNGYQIITPGTCAQSLIANQAKVVEFKLVDVGSPKVFDVIVNMKIKHKGKNFNVDLKVPSRNSHAGEKKVKI